MKRTFAVVLALSLLLIPSPPILQASVPQIPVRIYRSLGYQIVTPVAATGLTLPATTKHALISVRYFGVMMRDDGVNPTSGTGFYFPPGTIIQVENDRPWLTRMKFINTPDGAASVYVLYEGD